MKILKLRFKNLNSLYGEWNIDFTDPEYVASGIFAITGPTGAGKSTVLDAICLALYGSTPRLGKITKDNEIMSRCTGECFSEVTFQSQYGTFICHWEQHRARKKRDGKLSEAKHEISDAENGLVLESKKRNVADAIEVRTGMDFDRFTRSILLAQGGFDTFLKADADHRAPILEQITGTEIYSEISRKIHERKRDESQKLELLKSETQGISVLEDEDRTKLQENISSKEVLDSELACKNRELKDSLKWISGLISLREELSLLNSQEKDILDEFNAFKPERCKLDMAQRAVNLEGDYASLQSIRKSQNSDFYTLKAAEVQLSETEGKLKEADKCLHEAEEKVVKAKEECVKEAPVIRQVRYLDHSLSGMKNNIEAGKLDCEKISREIDIKAEEIMGRELELQSAQSEFDKIEVYLSKNARHELLVAQITGIEEQLKNLNSKYDELKDTNKSLKEAERKLADLTSESYLKLNSFEMSRKALESLQSSIENIKKELDNLLNGQLLREHRTRRDSLMRELTLVRKIEQLEDERANLEDGKACPLCGALKHPFAEGNLPEKGPVERDIDNLEVIIVGAEKLEKSIKDLEQEEREKTSDCSRYEIDLSTAKNRVDYATVEINRLRTELDSSDKTFRRLKESILLCLEPMGIAVVDGENTEAILTDLKRNLNNWKEKETERARIQDAIKELTSSIKSGEAVLETVRVNQRERQGSLDKAEVEYSSQLEEREKLYGFRDPDEEENRLARKTVEFESKEKAERETREGAVCELESVKARIISLKEAISARLLELDNHEKKFSISLEKAGFPDEADFTYCRLSQEERTVLSDKAKELDSGKADLETRKKDREKALKKEEVKAITQESLEELEKQDKDIEAQQKKLGQDLGALKQSIEEDCKARSRVTEKQKIIEAQSRECLRWGKLHKLIGSSDGKLYRNFAQGITFELMVSHANRQLIKMTDRYLLTRNKEESLELNVVDNYQAGEVRSTRNLSGGESFIVSLALALGLSQMASRKVRVDSLFLDEGFGTLDEDSLDTALETLANLQHDGKLIGVISHVGALKERIPTQIEIIKSSGGKSRIQGPGCSKN